jgi:NHLM bacteriocin system ABC transporter peptidase/ATP-binding protein
LGDTDVAEQFKTARRKKCVKVPVVMQMEALECGAACLCMILAYHGKWIPLEQVRSDCGISRDGSTASNINKAARAYGFLTKANKYDVKAARELAIYPAIIHWNFNHFVVLNGFKGSKAVINDPARGLVEVTAEEFDQSFTGICLQFEPSESFVKGGKPKSVLNFARTRLKGTFVPILFVMLTGILTGFSGILTPAFARIFTDNILSGQNPGWLYPFTAAMAGLVVFQLIVAMINAVYLLKIKGKLAIVSNASFMWHTLRLPMEFYSQRMAGDIVSRQESNDDVAETLISKLAPILLNFGLLIFYLIVMLRYSVMLTAIGLGSVALNLFLARYISRKRINITRARMRDQGKLDAATVSGIEMIETIKSAGAENGFFERWAGYHAAVNRSLVNFAVTNQLLGAIPELVQELSSIIILALGAWLILLGEYTVGMLLAFQTFMTLFLNPVNELISAGQSIQEMRSSMERIDDVMEYKPDVMDTDVMPNEKTEYKKLSGAVEIKNITFGYSRLANPLLENFSLSLKPGSKVAFVGSSGCGKSTIAKLISGLYNPWSGEILFDGMERKNIPREVFTGSLAVVDQDIIMFEDSVSDNIKMWDSSIEDFEMIMAARDAQIHENIMLRDGGYNCKVAEGGKNFSGGERQRFEIARVLAQDPTIVILDEATSALDAKTEFEVTSAIKDRGVTCIIVAHRLSTIRDCDEIIVMDKGHVVERGTHDELIKSGGMYSKLITTE